MKNSRKIWKAAGILSVILCCIYVAVMHPFRDNPASRYLVSAGTESSLYRMSSQSVSIPVTEQENGWKADFYIEQAGNYCIVLTYEVNSEIYQEPSFQCWLNGRDLMQEHDEIVLPISYSSQTYPFDLDSEGNEVVPETTTAKGIFHTALTAVDKSSRSRLILNLEQGEQKLELKSDASITIAQITVTKLETVPDYSAYVELFPQTEETKKHLIVLEAERLTYKNSTMPQAIAAREIEASPYWKNHMTMSMMGGETWKNNGQELSYQFTAQENGWYALSFKYKQDSKKNTYIYRTITIDGEIPFRQAKQAAFPASDKLKTITLGGEEEPYLVYLTKGEHTLGITVDNQLLIPSVEVIQSVVTGINNLSLEIQKITGNNEDIYRDWQITEYIPGLAEELNQLADHLDLTYDNLLQANFGVTNNKYLTTLKIAVNQLKKLAAEPDKIPNHMNMLSKGSGSVSQLLGDMAEELLEQPLKLDQIYIHSAEADLPEYKVSALGKLGEEFLYFLNSFRDTGKENEDMVTIEIWVNRARNYIDLMQKYTDANFTPNSNIKVKYSIMPNEQKLILANTTHTQPDVALGVSPHLPYDLAIRNAVYNLRNFEDFGEVLGRFSPGALVSHTYEDGVYALPETQDFYVLFYRKDLMEALDIPLPDTWDEVLEILPVLQRYGMNFYVPIASDSSFKTFAATLPFIYQFGGEIYGEDGLSIRLNEEGGLNAMKFMTDLFTVYGLPSQVANFYQQFRSGTIPIGVANISTYLKLNTAAGELKGQWDIAPMPGVADEEGNVRRYAMGGSTTCVIFEQSSYHEESWEFLKWWMSKEVQADYAKELQMLYGDEYIWNSANLEAFAQIPIREEHKEIIVQQWEWLQEVPKTPASYMVEREISNVWNSIVFDGENARSALDDAAIIMEQELLRKMEEFGYLKNGVKVKEYKVPTVDMIREWVKE